MRVSRLLGLAIALAIGFAVQANAAIVPWSNPNGVAPGFVWANGHNDTNLFGSPTVVGNQFIFTPSNFIANSNNGVSGTAHDTTQVDITLNPGFVLQQINVFELGDYQISGAGSVNAGGTLVLTDLINGGLPSFGSLITNPAMPVSTPTAGAAIWTGSATAALGPNTTSFRLTLDNILNALSAQGGASFIEKKFASGVVVEIIIPEPATLGLLAVGAPMILARRRRK